MAVLVVEDDPEVRCLLEREVADLGHPVTACGTAERALEALEEQRFAVVITDIRMPGMDGVELTRTIKERWPESEVIIITGFASVDSASRAVRLGAADYLTKPFGDLRRIGDSLALALERHQRHRATMARIDQLEAHRETLADLLDRLPMGVLLINGAGKVLMANGVGAAILAQRDGLSTNHRGQLAAGELRGVIARASRVGGDGARVGGAATLRRPSGAAPLSLLVLPLADPARDVGEDQPAAALFVSDPDRRPGTAEELLCRLYGLTPTEARIAAILMQGRSAEDAASELAISINTARTHLKHLFSKTCTTRQGDLISLLLSGPALLRMDDSV